MTSSLPPRKIVQLPITREEAMRLRAGELLSLRGVLYTARDAAHKRLIAALTTGEALPFDITNAAIYYAGPCPARPGMVIGSAGPTTSGRMDAYAPALIEQGQTVMLGKGLRNKAVVESMKKYGAVYLGATGGAGALLSQCITASEIVAYPDLGAEAIRRMEVYDFPAIVLIDSLGTCLYDR
jgi:fumarate hydratase subunit beta